MLRSLMMVAPKKRPPEVTTYTTSGAHTVPVPPGALLLTAECISSGGNTTLFLIGTYNGGGGGAFSKRIDYPMTGITSLGVRVGDASSDGEGMSYVTVPPSQVICSAAAVGADGRLGALASSGVGDVRYSGGDGSFAGGGQHGGGGGAANDGGQRRQRLRSLLRELRGPGLLNPEPAGSSMAAAGNVSINSGYGLRGWVKLTFTF